MLEGGDELSGHQPPQLTWAEFAEKQCPHYIAMGMTADDYWNGDHSLLKYYRKAHVIQQEQSEFDAWLYGAYVYEAICRCSPILRAFSKARSPEKYIDNPFKTRRENDEKAKQESLEKQTQTAVDLLNIWATNVNARFEKKKGGGEIAGQRADAGHRVRDQGRRERSNRLAEGNDQRGRKDRKGSRGDGQGSREGQ